MRSSRKLISCYILQPRRWIGWATRWSGSPMCNLSWYWHRYFLCLGERSYYRSCSQRTREPCSKVRSQKEPQWGYSSQLAAVAFLGRELGLDGDPSCREICWSGTEWGLYNSETHSYSSTNQLFVGSSTSYLVTDIGLLGISVSLTWNIHLHSSRKVILTAIFALGIMYLAPFWCLSQLHCRRWSWDWPF